MRVFLTLLLVLVNFSAVAEDSLLSNEPLVIDELLQPAPQNSYKALRDPEPYKDVPLKYLEEAERFHQECRSDEGLYQFYNCECLSVKFLDVRIESGPDRGGDSILLSLQRECKDGTYAAGIAYENCMTSGTLLFAKGKTPEEYCACFGNNVAKLYESRSVLPGTAAYVDLLADAHGVCQ